MDRASDYGSEGWEFESLRARQKNHPYGFGLSTRSARTQAFNNCPGGKPKQCGADTHPDHQATEGAHDRRSSDCCQRSRLKHPRRDQYEKDASDDTDQRCELEDLKRPIASRLRGGAQGWSSWGDDGRRSVTTGTEESIAIRLTVVHFNPTVVLIVEDSTAWLV